MTARRDFGAIYSTGTPTRPRFFVRWYEGSKRRKLSGFKSKTEAQAALARLQAGLADGTSLPRKREQVSFHEAAQQWLTQHSAVMTKRSHALNLMNYKQHLQPFFGEVPIAAVDAKRIFAFRAHVDGKGLAPRTVNLMLALVRAILRRAAVHGQIAASPTGRMARGTLMLPVEGKKLQPPIERREDVGRLLEAIREIRPSRHAMFATFLYTGCRKGEISALTWQDVDFEARMIHVRRSYYGVTKSGKERMVPMPLALAAILRQHKQDEPFGGELVFPNDDGTMYTKNGKLEDTLRPALTKCGLPQIRIHDLRHAYAAFFLMAGGSIYDLSKNLGHHNVTFTDTQYGHLSADHRVQQADKLDFTPAEPGKVIPFPAPGDLPVSGQSNASKDTLRTRRGQNAALASSAEPGKDQRLREGARKRT